MRKSPRRVVEYHARRVVMATLFRPADRVGIEYLGSDWGGWAIVRDSLGPESVVYSGGVGRDTTFDEALIERYGCTVDAFDPTPIGRAHGETVGQDNPRFRFHPWGLWDDDGTVEFFEPPRPDWDSFSILNLSESSRSVPGEVRRLGTILETLGHNHIDLLKIDIEGAEHAVLADALRAGIEIRQLCVEFDQPAKLSSMYQLVRRLQRNGLRLVARKQWDYTFAR